MPEVQGDFAAIMKWIRPRRPLPAAGGELELSGYLLWQV